MAYDLKNEALVHQLVVERRQAIEGIEFWEKQPNLDTSDAVKGFHNFREVHLQRLHDDLSGIEAAIRTLGGTVAKGS